jgi:hypothetical protein
MNHQTKPYQPTILKDLNGEDWENPVDGGDRSDEESNKPNIESLNDTHRSLCGENEEFDYDCLQVDGQYVSKQVKEFNRPNVSQQYKDSALYRIGTHANLFTDKETAYSCLNIGSKYWNG